MTTRMHMTYVAIIRGAKERAGEMQERYTFLASLYEVMEGNGVAISDDTRTAANMIVKVFKSQSTWKDISRWLAA